VFRLFPLGLRGRDLLFTTVSWVSGPDSRDLLLIDILSKPRPLTSTATISAGNLQWIALSRSLPSMSVRLPSTWKCRISTGRGNGISKRHEAAFDRQFASLSIYIHWTVVSTICRSIKGSNGVLGWTYLSAIA